MSIPDRLIRRKGMCWSKAALLTLVRDPGIEVAPLLRGRWSELAPALREHLAAFLAPEAEVVTRIEVAESVSEGVPASFTADLAGGGALLRAAFPDLERRLVSIEVAAGAEGAVAVRVACEGTHAGAFFGFMLPTRRRVRFEELHELAVRGGAVSDRVTIDVRAIVRQLVGAPSIARAAARA